MLDEEVWQGWLDHPATKALRAFAQLKRKDLLDAWVSGGFTGPTLEETVIRNVAATGAASVYQEFQELSYQHIIGELANEGDAEERIGAEAARAGSLD